MSTRLPGLALLLVLACSGPRGEVPAASADHDVLTPGLCGPWERTDSTELAACQRVLLRDPPPGLDSLFPGDCGFYQTTSLDSLRACLHRIDSTATACPVARAFRVRQADGVLRAAEWRRCGPQGGAFVGDSIVWPLHFLLLRRDTAPTSPPIFALSNAAEPGAAGLDTALAIDFDGDGTDELFYLNRIYGTGAAFESCALAVTGGKLRCWSGPDFTVPPGALQKNETLFKGWIPVAGEPGMGERAGVLTLAPGGGLWYFTPVYREGDPNCCSSAGASLWLEARPRAGRFATGLVLRAREDSTGAILGIDTIYR